MAFKPLAAVFGVLTAAYPLLVYAGLGRLEPRHLAWLLAGLALARALISRQAFWWAAAAGAGGLALVGGVGNALLPLKLYPVLVNAVFLTVFGVSLLHPPSAVERLARLTEPDLPAAARPYTRRVTQAWCVFFLVNGLLALATALWASNDVWALYNGLISYGLMGTLFGAEWLVRRRVRARIEAAAAREAAHG